MLNVAALELSLCTADNVALVPYTWLFVLAPRLNPVVLFSDKQVDGVKKREAACGEERIRCIFKEINILGVGLLLRVVSLLKPDKLP